MKALITVIAFLGVFFNAAAQTDTTQLVFLHEDGLRTEVVLKRDYLKMLDNDGNYHYGSFRKFKDSLIYTNLDTINLSEIELFKVNTYKQQKTSSAYMAIGISGILNVAGFHFAFASNSEETIIEPTKSTSSIVLGLGYGLTGSSLITGLVLYNYYDSYRVGGDTPKWKLSLE